MRKHFVASTFALTALVIPGAYAQEAGTSPESAPATTEQPAGDVSANPFQGENLRVLVDQYATATLGFLIEDRCKQLEEGARKRFTEDFLVLDRFIGELIGVGPRELIVRDMAASADDVELNPCDTDTFRFSLTMATITSQLAGRIGILQDQGLTVTSPNADPATAAQPETQPAPVKTETTQPVETKPVSLPPSTAPAVESKKDMSRRHRDEIIDLRGRHREELKRFEDNENSYPDPKEAKKQLLDRQDQELDALRERHQQEEDARDAAEG